MYPAVETPPISFRPLCGVLMKMEFVNLANGKRKVLFESYIYVKQKELSGGRISWECSRHRNNRSCKAKIKTNNDVFEARTNVHTCNIPDPEEFAILKARNQMRMHGFKSNRNWN